MCNVESFCIHARLKETCSDCNGSQVCPHSLVKSNCKKCSATAACPHGLIKRFCKSCNGSAFCAEHGKRKQQCKECGGSARCPHGKIKRVCSEPGCAGSAVCQHRKIKYRCKECKALGVVVLLSDVLQQQQLNQQVFDNIVLGSLNATMDASTSSMLNVSSSMFNPSSSTLDASSSSMCGASMIDSASTFTSGWDFSSYPSKTATCHTVTDVNSLDASSLFFSSMNDNGCNPMFPENSAISTIFEFSPYAHQMAVDAGVLTANDDLTMDAYGDIDLSCFDEGLFDSNPHSVTSGPTNSTECSN